jgi:hypothetical protein
MGEGKVIDKDLATEEVNKWLDFHDVTSDDREEEKKTINRFIDEVQKGNLIINDDFTLVQKLRFPLTIEGTAPVDELKYANRISMDKVQSRMTGIKAEDGAGRVCAHIAALTSRPLGLIRKMDSKDYKVASAIFLVFFS